MKGAIVVTLSFPEGCDETYSEIVVPVIPRPGDIIASRTPDSGKYRVDHVEFVIDDFTSSEGPHAASIVVHLEGLDETTSVPKK